MQEPAGPAGWAMGICAFGWFGWMRRALGLTRDSGGTASVGMWQGHVRGPGCDDAKGRDWPSLWRGDLGVFRTFGAVWMSGTVPFADRFLSGEQDTPAQ